MTRKEVLELLFEIVAAATVSEEYSDVLDPERLMRAIQVRLNQCEGGK